MRTSPQLEFSPGFFLTLAALLLMLPLGWCLALIGAAAFHELCHLLALRLCGGQVRLTQLGAGGAVIRACALTPGKTLLCTLAGPIGALLLLCLVRWFPRLALCAALQSAFNLLPIGGLDGGHALRCCLELLLPPSTAAAACRTTERVILILIGGLGFCGTFILKLGLLPILAAGILILKGTGGKIPCK